jgi:hypothetical protein
VDTKLETQLNELAAASSIIADEAVLYMRLGVLVSEHDAAVELARREFDTACTRADKVFISAASYLYREVHNGRQVPELPDDYDDEDDD